jgi:hypothetical protein
MRGKRVQFDDETWHALNLLGHDQMKDFQELADEAFRDLLRKHGRPLDLKEALRRSAGVSNVVPLQGAKDKKEKGKSGSASKSKAPPKGER